MKNKNLILGLVAFVFAIGSAFTTINSPATNAFVKVKFSGNPNFTCVNTGIQCAETGDATCKITVQIDDPAGTKTVLAHPNNGCTTTLLNTDVEIPGIYNPGGAAIIDAED